MLLTNTSKRKIPFLTSHPNHRESLPQRLNPQAIVLFSHTSQEGKEVLLVCSGRAVYDTGGCDEE